MSVPPGDLPPMDPLHLCYWVYVNRPDSGFGETEKNRGR
jgi:hypothetical protein